MDTTITQKTSSTSSNSQANSQCLDRSQMWKEKDADLQKDDIFAKVWEQDFSISADITANTKTEEKIPLPTISNSSGDKIFRFFWWDAFEDPYKHPGVVHLFGKVFVSDLGDYVSCCVAVRNIPRKIYALPREFVC